jgi:hypothetical protein
MRWILGSVFSSCSGTVLCISENISNIFYTRCTYMGMYVASNNHFSIFMMIITDECLSNNEWSFLKIYVHMYTKAHFLWWIHTGKILAYIECQITPFYAFIITCVCQKKSCVYITTAEPRIYLNSNSGSGLRSSRMTAEQTGETHWPEKIKKKMRENGVESHIQGDQIWTNFRFLGGCLLWSVFKLHK